MNLVVFTGIGCFKGTFKLRVKEDGHPYQALPRSVAYTRASTQRGTIQTAEKRDNCTVGCKQNIRVVQQFYLSTQDQQQGVTMPASSKVQQGAD